MVAHNRYWATDNVYAKQNGGAYDFIVEEENKVNIEWTEMQDWLLNNK